MDHRPDEDGNSVKHQNSTKKNTTKILLRVTEAPDAAPEVVGVHTIGDTDSMGRASQVATGEPEFKTQ